jgi:NAD(P)-dependent dehydrogenase (short-subunit alcohol dehydrogenase family)
VITGASRGLGRSIALALGEAGVNLALVGRDEKRLQEVAEKVHQLGAEAETFFVDVTDEDQVMDLSRVVIARFGRLEILINNAGISIRKPVTDFTLVEWRRVIDTNLTGPFLICRAFVPHMKGHGYGRIINLTSTMSHIALPGRSAYAASKAGLLGFTRVLALELAPEKITVNGISPGPFATEMNKPLIDDPKQSSQFLSRIPLGVWGRPEDIGRLAVYLCSEEANFITGTDILIDGGWTTQ